MSTFYTNSKYIYKYFIQNKEGKTIDPNLDNFQEQEKTLVEIISRGDPDNFMQVTDELGSFSTANNLHPGLKVISSLILADRYVNASSMQKAANILDEISLIGFDGSWSIYEAWHAQYQLIKSQCCMNKGDFDIGRQLLSNAREVFQDLTDLHGVSQSYTIEGILETRAGNYSRSNSCFSEALDLLNKTDCKTGKAHTLNSIGNLRKLEGRSTEAIECYKNSISEYLEVGWYQNIASISLNLTDIYKDLEQYDAASDQLELAFEISQKTDNYYVMVVAHLAKGEILRHQNHAGESIEYLKGIRNFIEEYASQDQLGLYYIQLGLSYTKLGQHDVGIENLLTARNYIYDLEDKQLLIYTTNLIGNVLLELGEFEKANNCFETSRDLADSINRHMEKQWSEYHLARSYYKSGKLKEAQQHFREVLYESKKSGNAPLEANILQYLGEISRQQGDITLAFELYDFSLEKFKESGDNKSIAMLLTNMGRIHQLQQNFDSALEFYSEGMIYLNDSQDLVAKAYTLFNMIYILAPRKDPRVNSYFNYMVRLNEVEQDPQIDTLTKITEALILKEERRGRSVYKAQELLTSVLDDKVSDYELSIITLKILCETLIEEYKVYRNREILEQIEEILEKAYNYGHIQETSPLMIDIFVLRSRLAFVNNNFSEIDKYLQEAEEMISSTESEYLSHKLQNVKEEIFTELSEMRDTIKEGEGLKKDHYEESVLGYIDTLLSDIRQQTSSEKLEGTFSDEYLK